MKIKMVLLLAFCAMGGSYATANCDVDGLCDLAGEIRNQHIPYARAAANQAFCPGSYDESGRAYLEAAAASVKSLQTELCSSSPNLSEALQDAKAARNALNSSYVNFRRAITNAGCQGPEIEEARDRAYQAWKYLNWMVYLLEADCL